MLGAVVAGPDTTPKMLIDENVETFTGLALAVVVESSNCPCELAPEQYAELSLMKQL